MALTDPVPSQAIDVFKRNMEDSDRFVNQTSGTVTNRTGRAMRPLPVIVDDIEQKITGLSADILDINTFNVSDDDSFTDNTGKQKKTIQGIENDARTRVSQVMTDLGISGIKVLIQLSTDPFPNPLEYGEGQPLKFEDTLDEFTLINGAWVENGNVGDEVDVTAASHLTLAQAQASDLRVGQYVRLTDFKSGLYEVVTLADTGGVYKSLDGTTKKLRLVVTDLIKTGWYIADTGDVTTNLQELADFYCASDIAELHHTPCDVTLTASITWSDMTNKIMTGAKREAVYNATFANDTIFIFKKASLADVDGFWLKGNDVRGVGGTGHGAHFLGETINGTDYPQASKFRAAVSQCRGLVTYAYAGDINPASGVYMDKGLGCSVETAWLVGNGQGVRFDDMEQSSVDDKTVSFDNDMCGVLAYDCSENIAVNDSDILGNGKNHSNLSIGGALVPVGDIVSISSDQLTSKDNKFKDTRHAIVAFRNKIVNVYGGSIKPYAGFDGIWLQGCSTHNIGGIHWIYVYQGGGANYGGVYIDIDRFDKANLVNVEPMYFDLADDISHLLKITNSDSSTRETTLNIQGFTADSFFRTVATAGTLTAGIILESDGFKGKVSNIQFCAGNNYVINAPLFYGANFVDLGIIYENITQNEYNGGSITNKQTFLEKHSNAASFKAVAVPEEEFTISNGVITVGQVGGVRLRGEGGTSDSLSSISAGVDGQELLIRPATNSQPITVEHNTGNILLSGDANLVLSATYKTVKLRYISSISYWVQA